MIIPDRRAPERVKRRLFTIFAGASLLALLLSLAYRGDLMDQGKAIRDGRLS